MKILLADDHRLVRQGIRSLLCDMVDVERVDEADDGAEALRLAEELDPDLVLMDVAMPRLNGIDATRRLRKRQPGVRVIALSVHNDPRFVAEMLNAGASGYLAKDCAFEELARAVRAVHAGDAYVSPVLTRPPVRSHRSGRSSGPKIRLSAREREILQLLTDGKGTREIATLLCLSVKTVETHRQHITQKLDLHSVAELTKYAIREGLTSLNR